MYERTYHAKVLKQEGRPDPKRPFRWKRALWVLGVIVLFSGIVYLTKFPRFQVVHVAVIGTSVADPIEVSDFVAATLEGHYIHFLPKTSILLIRTGNLARRIQRQFPRFKTVEVNRTNMSSLEITVTEYPGVYLWCMDEATCSFMDEAGTVFAPAPYFSGNAYIKAYGTIENSTAKEYPYQPIDASSLALMKVLIDKLHGIAIDPSEFHFMSSHQLDVVFTHHGRAAHLYFDPTRDISSALDVLYTGIRTEPLLSLYGDQAKVLQYIDLRFSNKIVYKFL